MNKTIRTTLLIVLLCLARSVQSQEMMTVTQLLEQVQQNNLSLRALQETNTASIYDERAENALGSTSVEYSPFFTSGVSGLASSELIVTQEFDFPTRYAARRKVADRKAQLGEMQLLTMRREILLQAKACCADLITAQLTGELLQRRLSVADSLDALMRQRQQQGDATQLDINRVSLDRMAVVAELTENAATRQSLIQSLTTLNGGVPVGTVLPDSSLTALSELPSAALAVEVRQAQSELNVARQLVKAQHQNWLPSLTLGYRRNTDLGDKLHGMLIGGSLTLFGNDKKLRAAQHRQTAAALQAEETEQRIAAEIQAQAAELAQLDRALKAYDEPLMQQTLDLLMRALQHRELTLLDYYTEADAIYARQLERLALQCKYWKAIALLQR